MTASLSPYASGNQNLFAWLLFLIASSIGFSYFFACAAPFAALATFAALTLRWHTAFPFILSVWAANQLVGFLLLDYPQTPGSYAWGGVMAIAALGATYAAIVATRLTVTLATGKTASELLRYGIVFIAAFAAYEIMLLLATLTSLGGIEDFTAEVVGRVLSIDVMALVVLYVVNRLAIMSGLLDARRKNT